ncbi:hypothetical protein TCE0_050f18423 [Talaromyces pinophilus]|uniref:Uncharacterized protein n=1 Tax=Talaromyces pinophilus TaxID=128442 RepID=A0A0B8MZC2_TALPI|nr:hypothetical protein TCE0_050f18423 [Talaromyces pinophilus]
MYRPPPGPPPGWTPQQQDQTYRPPPGPPPGWTPQQQDEAYDNPPPYHNWQEQVPDTSMLPPPPAMSRFESETGNASDRAREFCNERPLWRPVRPSEPIYTSTQSGDIRPGQPIEYRGKLDAPGHGFVAQPYPSWRSPGWDRASVGVFSDDGCRFVNDNLGGKEFTSAFRTGETVGIGMRFSLPATATATGAQQQKPDVRIFFTRNGAEVGEWDLHEELDSEAEGVYGLEGDFDLYAAVGIFGGVEVDVKFDRASWSFRQQKHSNASSTSSLPDRNQELESMYDYLAKVILIGPSGTGKSCLLHRFVKDEWRVLSSQTIGVEFSSKIVKIGTGSRRKRIKLQLWDTAGTERFRSVSRSYYRGAAGAVLVYDISSYTSFSALSTFLMDARALASPNLTTILAGNKADLLADDDQTEILDTEDEDVPSSTSMANSVSSSKNSSSYMFDGVGGKGGAGSLRSVTSTNFAAGTRLTATTNSHGRQVSDLEAIEWATRSNIPVAVEVSAFSGQNVDELFTRLARIILTKIELGEIDPDDPQSGIQYGDSVVNFTVGGRGAGDEIIMVHGGNGEMFSEYRVLLAGGVVD